MRNRDSNVTTLWKSHVHVTSKKTENWVGRRTDNEPACIQIWLKIGYVQENMSNEWTPCFAGRENLSAPHPNRLESTFLPMANILPMILTGMKTWWWMDGPPWHRWIGGKRNNSVSWLKHSVNDELQTIPAAVCKPGSCPYHSILSG